MAKTKTMLLHGQKVNVTILPEGNAEGCTSWNKQYAVSSTLSFAESSVGEMSSTRESGDFVRYSRKPSKYRLGKKK